MNQQKMTPHQALELLNRVTGADSFAANRTTQLSIMQALAVLQEAITPKTAPDTGFRSNPEIKNLVERDENQKPS